MITWYLERVFNFYTTVELFNTNLRNFIIEDPWGG